MHGISRGSPCQGKARGRGGLCIAWRFCNAVAPCYIVASDKYIGSYIYNVGLWWIMATTTRAHYAADLTTLLKIVDELNNSLMMPARRAVLETCKEALEVVLDLYEISNI